MLKNRAKHFICRYITYNIAQMKDAFAQVLRDEIAGEVCRQSFLHAPDSRKGMDEGFIVAGIRYDDIAGLDVWKSGKFHQLFLQGDDVLSFLGGYLNDCSLWREEGGRVRLVNFAKGYDDLFAFKAAGHLPVECLKG